MRVLLADDLAGRLTTLSLAPQSSSASRLTAGALFVRGHGRRHRRGVFKKAAFAAESSVLLIGDAALVSKGCSASAEIASSISTAFNVLLCCLGDFLAPALQIVAPAAVAKPSSRKAIRLDPKDVPAYNNRGEAYRAKGDLDPAIADYNEAIRHSPVSCDLDCAWSFFMMNMVVGRTCGAREAGVVRVDLMLSVPQMFRRQPLDQLV